MQVRILDLDGSLVGQRPLRDRLVEGRAHLFPLRHWGPSLRLWATRRAYDAFDTFWRAQAESAEPALTLVGSGDYHHLTASFVGAAPGPLSVVHFDNHPDWCWSMPPRHCGSWVNHVLAMPHVARVVTIGPSSHDLARPDRKGADLEALSNGRLEVFPWRHAPSRVVKRMGSGAGHSVEDGQIVWQNLEDMDWEGFLDELVTRLPTRRVWITVDKDVLPRDEAVTNWDQGGLPLAKLVAAIRRLTARFEIVGADICGDFAPGRYGNLLKLAEARLDQPPPVSDPPVWLNARANDQLIRAFENVS